MASALPTAAPRTITLIIGVTPFGMSGSDLLTGRQIHWGLQPAGIRNACPRCGALCRAPCSHAGLCCLTTKPGDESGLAGGQGALHCCGLLRQPAFDQIIQVLQLEGADSWAGMGLCPQHFAAKFPVVV